MNGNMKCMICGEKYSEHGGEYVCRFCGGGIERKVITKDNREKLKTILKNGSGYGIWGYAPFLGTPSEMHAVTLDEGNTPLLHATNLGKMLGIENIYLKNETLNPSGTYKDRFATVAVSLEKHRRTSLLALGSAGNAAAAVSAYAAAANLPCVVLLPIGAVKERALQTMSYGAKLFQIEGTIDKCIRIAIQGEEKGLWKNVSTTMKHYPDGSEGYKTIAYEIERQLKFDIPDWVICPVGGGTLLCKIFKGYQEMVELGLIHKMPKFAAVQAEGCKPFVQAFEKGEKETELWENPETIAFAISDVDTFEGRSALWAVRKTGGTAVCVNDEEILEAMTLLSCHEAVLAEPSSAVTLAALKKLISSKVIDKKESAVCVITGSAMRDLMLLTKKMQAPEVIKEASLEKVRKKLEIYNL